MSARASKSRNNIYIYIYIYIHIPIIFIYIWPRHSELPGTVFYLHESTTFDLDGSISPAGAPFWLESYRSGIIYIYTIPPKTLQFFNIPALTPSKTQARAPLLIYAYHLGPSRPFKNLRNFNVLSLRRCPKLRNASQRPPWTPSGSIF